VRGEAGVGQIGIVISLVLDAGLMARSRPPRLRGVIPQSRSPVAGLGSCLALL
jgi:hypothetical protein